MRSSRKCFDESDSPEWRKNHVSDSAIDNRINLKIKSSRLESRSTFLLSTTTSYLPQPWPKPSSLELQVMIDPKPDKRSQVLIHSYPLGGIGQPLALLLKANPLISEVRSTSVFRFFCKKLNPVFLPARLVRYRQHSWCGSRSLTYRHPRESRRLLACWWRLEKGAQGSWYCCHSCWCSTEARS